MQGGGVHVCSGMHPFEIRIEERSPMPIGPLAHLWTCAGSCSRCSLRGRTSWRGRATSDWGSWMSAGGPGGRRSRCQSRSATAVLCAEEAEGGGGPSGGRGKTGVWGRDGAPTHIRNRVLRGKVKFTKEARNGSQLRYTHFFFAFDTPSQHHVLPPSNGLCRHHVHSTQVRTIGG